MAYSRSDNDVAQPLIAHMRAHDLQVWWDVNDIPIGVNWENFLVDELTRASCVLVLWSYRSVTSKWVLFEAEQAFRRNVLLPVRIDDVEVPRPFSSIHAASLISWRENGDEAELARLMNAIDRFARNAPDAGQMTRVFKESQRVAELRARELLVRNLSSEVIVEHADLQETPFGAAQEQARLCAGAVPQRFHPLGHQRQSIGRCSRSRTRMPASLASTRCGRSRSS